MFSFFSPLKRKSSIFRNEHVLFSLCGFQGTLSPLDTIFYFILFLPGGRENAKETRANGRKWRQAPGAMEVEDSGARAPQKDGAQSPGERRPGGSGHRSWAPDPSRRGRRGLEEGGGRAPARRPCAAERGVSVVKRAPQLFRGPNSFPLWVAAPLEWSKPQKRVPFLFPGSLNN